MEELAKSDEGHVFRQAIKIAPRKPLAVASVPINDRLYARAGVRR